MFHYKSDYEHVGWVVTDFGDLKTLLDVPDDLTNYKNIGKYVFETEGLLTKLSIALGFSSEIYEFLDIPKYFTILNYIAFVNPDDI